MERLDRQLSVDTHPVTARSKQNITLVSWNVRTLNNCGDLENVKRDEYAKYQHLICM